MNTKPNILLIYTGGTIGMIKDSETGALQNFNFDELLKYIPELNLLECNIASHSFLKPIDSSNMNPTFWVEIGTIIEDNYNIYDGFVVLHGSDTMSYTASALSFMLENLTKPVIFTGSQLPIGDLRTDAKENLITSIQIASLHKDNKPVITEELLSTQTKPEIYTYKFIAHELSFTDFKTIFYSGDMGIYNMNEMYKNTPYLNFDIQKVLSKDRKYCFKICKR